MHGSPHSCSGSPTKAYFQSSRAPRRRRRRPDRVGAARRLAVEQPAPGQERGVRQAVVRRLPPARPTALAGRCAAIASVAAQQEGVGAVGQHDHGDRLAGLGPVQHVGEEEPGLGRAGVARRSWRGRRPSRRRGRTPTTAATGAPPGRAGRHDQHGRRRRRVRPACLRASATRGLGQRDVDVLAEALLPHPARR